MLLTLNFVNVFAACQRDTPRLLAHHLCQWARTARAMQDTVDDTAHLAQGLRILVVIARLGGAFVALAGGKGSCGGQMCGLEDGARMCRGSQIDSRP